MARLNFILREMLFSQETIVVSTQIIPENVFQVAQVTLVCYYTQEAEKILQATSKQPQKCWNYMGANRFVNFNPFKMFWSFTGIQLPDIIHVTDD